MKTRAQPGYYPRFSTMAQKSTWDDATRTLVEKRVDDIPPLRFFSPFDVPLARAVFDRLLPQDDRDEAHRVPILNYVDEKLYTRKLEGFRHENMPDHPWAIRRGLLAIDTTARQLHGKGFVDLRIADQEALLLRVRDDKIDLPKESDAGKLWEEIEPGHFWTLMLGDVLGAYYSHPFAWDEIGFGGPAYPRGYMRLENGEPEPWETEESRYEWEAPEGSSSTDYRPLSGVTADEKTGHGGSH